MATSQDVPTTDGMLQALRWLKDEISNEIDAKVALINGGASNALEGVAVDGTLQPVKNKIAMLGLSAYAKKTDVASGYHYKGSVNNFSDLPNTGMSEGDMYNILVAGGTDMNGDAIKAGDNVAWTGKGWDVLSGMVDLSQCVMKTPGKDLSTNDFTNADKAKLDSLTNSTYTLPTASSTTKGGFKVGNGLSMNGDTLNVTMVAAPAYTMPTASTTTKGGVKIGHGLQMQGETLNALASTYTLPTASATMKGGVKVGGGLQMNGDTLEAIQPAQYTLPTASKSTKGGFKVGDGLQMQGETLNVTLQSGDKYDAFEGATANFAGTSGLVPSPAGGDNTKFLRGDGTWAPATQNITVYSAAVTVPTNPQAFDGALWEDSLSNGDPVLKLRYGDYEFNFNYDTKNYTGTTPPPITPEDAQLYMLDTVPSTDEGTLWYNVTQSTYFPIPALCLHAGSFDYGYNYDTITYKGGKDGLYSYLPLQNTISDAMGKTWTTTRTDFSYVKLSNGVTALSNQTSVANSHKSGLVHSFSSPLSTFTIDFWFSWTSAGIMTADLTFVSILNLYGDSFGVQASKSTGNTSLRGIGGGGLGSLSTQYSNSSAYTILTKNEITNHSTRRVHLAMEHAGSGAAVVYLNGKRVATTSAFSSISEIAIMQYCQKTGSSSSKPMYIDHFRVWNKVVWDGDFEVPKLSDY